MAPRKGKSPGKRNNLKIKSKINTRKREIKLMKKNKVGEKPLENLKWLHPISKTNVVNQSKSGPTWFDERFCKHRRGSRGSASRSADYVSFVREDPGMKSSSTDYSEVSENSDECHCLYPKYADDKSKVLKRKISSTDSVVAKYIKSGMDHVASFIVESAIRFGEHHGVVVADKNIPNVYEIISPDKRNDEKFRKIRFKVNKKKNHNENRKWRKQRNSSRLENRSQEEMRSVSDAGSRRTEAYCSKSSSWSSKTDSLEDILPLLEKLKNDKGVVTSDLDINIFKRKSPEDSSVPRERLRDRHKIFDKRYKNVNPTLKPSEEKDYTTSKYPWKKDLGEIL